MRVDLDWDERQRIVELLRDQLDDTQSGSRCGYGQEKSLEVSDIDTLIRKLED